MCLEHIQQLLLQPLSLLSHAQGGRGSVSYPCVHACPSLITSDMAGCDWRRGGVLCLSTCARGSCSFCGYTQVREGGGSEERGVKRDEGRSEGEQVVARMMAWMVALGDVSSVITATADQPDVKGSDDQVGSSPHQSSAATSSSSSSSPYAMLHKACAMLARRGSLHPDMAAGMQAIISAVDSWQRSDSADVAHEVVGRSGGVREEGGVASSAAFRNALSRGSWRMLLELSSHTAAGVSWQFVRSQLEVQLGFARTGDSSAGGNGGAAKRLGEGGGADGDREVRGGANGGFPESSAVKGAVEGIELSARRAGEVRGKGLGEVRGGRNGASVAETRVMLLKVLASVATYGKMAFGGGAGGGGRGGPERGGREEGGMEWEEVVDVAGWLLSNLRGMRLDCEEVSNTRHMVCAFCFVGRGGGKCCLHLKQTVRQT